MISAVDMLQRRLKIAQMERNRQKITNTAENTVVTAMHNKNQGANTQQIQPCISQKARYVVGK